MNRAFLWVAGAGVVLAGVAGAIAQNSKPTQRDTLQTTKSLKSGEGAAVVHATNDFGFRLFSAVAAEQPDDNLFISPLSVSTALAMTYNGASGNTRDAMAKALGLSGLSLDQVNQANRDLLAALANTDPRIKLEVANSLWARKGYEFDRAFLDNTQNYYGALVKTIPFDESGRDAINGWVKEKTNGKIPEIVDEIPALAVLYLVNAIYFKAPWSTQFRPEETKEGNFHLASGRTVKAQMMNENTGAMYFKGNDFEVINLGYKGRCSMVIFLPDKGVSLREWMKNLNEANWEQWRKEMRPANGHVSLPKFHTESSKTLNKALTALGMGIAFDEKASFTNMTKSDPVHISRVLHKTYIDVNEEGTEAAGVTAVEMVATGMPATRFDFIADRPFFYAIVDHRTDAILFTGVLLKP